MNKHSNPRFYFSFRSPYSWLTAQLLEDRFPSAPRQIQYIPYWEPDAITLNLLREQGGEFLYTPMSREKHLYILQDIKRLVAKRRCQVVWPIDVNCWWELPHLAYLAARRWGKDHDFLWGAYRARWERGEDICNVEIIRRLASDVGADPEALVHAPENPEIRAQGVAALYSAYEDGVFGIPFLISKHAKFWGIDRFPDFAASLDEPSLPPSEGTQIPGEPRQVVEAVALSQGGPNPKALPGDSSDPGEIPATIISTIGSYDRDCPGGCG